VNHPAWVQECPVCQSADSLAVYRTPAVLHIGGHFEREEGAERDLFANILFFAMLMCRLCGHTMFISSEHFYSGDEPILTLEPLD
jgi:hypothetical protein